MNDDSRNAEHVERDTPDGIYERISEVLYQLRMGYDFPQAPLRNVLSAAQALADASGYTLVLQVEMLERQPGSDAFRSAGRRDVATAEPSLYDAQVIE